MKTLYEFSINDWSGKIKIKVASFEMEETNKTYKRKSGWPSLVYKSDIDVLRLNYSPTMISLSPDTSKFIRDVIDYKTKTINELSEKIKTEYGYISDLQIMLEAQEAT